MDKRITDLIEAHRAGNLETTAVVMNEPIEVAAEIMISRSLRLPLETFEALQRIAKEQGTKWSTLVRTWVIDNVTELDGGTLLSPVEEIERTISTLQNTTTHLLNAAAQLKQAA